MNKDLPEASLRYLKRIAEQMSAGYSGTIQLEIHNGGVRDFREIRSIRSTELAESDDLDFLRAS